MDNLVATYGYLAVALGVGLESMGLPIPGETILVVAAVYAATHAGLNIWLVVVAASAGAIVGDNLGYWLGGRFGYPLLLRFDEDLDEALGGPPIEHLERGYSLEEIRFNHELRDRMRRIDLDTINFEFGAWDVAPDQYPILERIAAAINRIIDRNPEEVFMIEGYTDAVGSDIDNLSLSDHRAQSVAEILTDDFNVPPENLVTQGYGKEYLKIPTNGPERANRRVAIRRITPLLSQGDDR